VTEVPVEQPAASSDPGSFRNAEGGFNLMESPDTARFPMLVGNTELMLTPQEAAELIAYQNKLRGLR
jgi:hypothetical protein